jgi:RNA polymerase sigma-70 factor (ECF subfamily)
MLAVMSDRQTGFGGEAGEPAIADAISRDLELERRFADGVEGALRDVYDRYASLVFGFCRRSLSTETAADATQETFVSAWRSRSGYDPSRGSIAGWLVGIARFKVIEQLRRTGRDAGRLTVVGSEPSSIGIDDLERVADRMLVAEALDQLAPRVRTVVELAFLEDLTQTEIAERCSLPLGTVKSDLRRGVERMRQHLQARSEARHGA